jgi:hypothetical protein
MAFEVEFTSFAELLSTFMHSNYLTLHFIINFQKSVKKNSPRVNPTSLCLLCFLVFDVKPCNIRRQCIYYKTANFKSKNGNISVLQRKTFIRLTLVVKCVILCFQSKVNRTKNEYFHT